MHGLSRRTFLTTSIGCCCLGLGVRRAAARTLGDVEGCALIGGDERLLNEADLSAAGKSGSGGFGDLSRTTGNNAMNVALDGAIKKISDVFEVMPGFAFCDDSESPNAWATPRSYIPGTDSTVVFGKTLFRRLMKFDDSGISVIIVVAHEFGHVRQFATDAYSRLMDNRKNSKLLELHADYQAGFYIGRLKANHADASFWKAGHKLWELGDYGFNNPGHHGTPDERAAAAEAGFKQSYTEKKHFIAAFNDGIDYIMRVF
jgi:hypothetical protein